MSVERDSPDTGPVVGNGTVLPVGTRLQEFETTGVVGEGGFGIVYEANDTLLQRRVAIKEYMPAQLASRIGARTVKVRSPEQSETFEAGLRSFINEARMLAQFKHAALVEVFRFWEENGTAYMAMPYYEGRTLKQFLSAHPEMANERWLRSMLAPLLDALEHMHEARIFHRDIAPDNILILKSGTPLLLDLGAARRIIGDMTQAITVILKPGYAPIEQYGEESGARQGPWTDIYALAAVLYYAITRRAPSPAVARMIRDPHKRLIDVASDAGFSAGFLQAIDLALSVRPEDRPQSIAQFREMLGVSTYTVSTPPSQTVMGMLADAPEVPPVRVSTPARDAGPEAVGAPVQSSSPSSRSTQSSQPAQPAEAGRGAPPPADAVAQSPLPFDPLPPLVSGEPLTPATPASRADSAVTPASAASPAQTSAKTPAKPAGADKSLDATRPVPRRADARAGNPGTGLPAPKAAGATSRGPLLVVVVGVAAVVGALVVVGALLMNSVGSEPPVIASTSSPSSGAAPATPPTPPGAPDAAPATPSTPPGAPDAAPAASASSGTAAPAATTATANDQASAASPPTAPAPSAPAAASSSPAAAAPSPAPAAAPPPAAPAASPNAPARAPSASAAAAPGTAPAAAAATVAAAPAERKGTLRLSIRPWGEVYVDGVARGVSPPLKRLALDEGAHDIEVRNPAGPSATRKIQIRQNQTADFEHRF